MAKESETLELSGVMLPANTVLYTGSSATNTLFTGNRISMSDGKESIVDGTIASFTTLANGNILITVAGAGDDKKKGSGRLVLTPSGMLCLVKS